MAKEVDRPLADKVVHLAESADKVVHPAESADKVVHLAESAGKVVHPVVSAGKVVHLVVSAGKRLLVAAVPRVAAALRVVVVECRSSLSRSSK